MTDTSPSDLVKLLRTPELRIRTGVLELAHDVMGHEGEVATQLDVGWADIIEYRLGATAGQGTHIDVSADRLLEDIGATLSIPSFGECVLVSSLDLLLCGASYDDRSRFWAFLREHFKRPRGLVVTMPLRARNLFPAAEREEWARGRRLSVWGSSISSHLSALGSSGTDNAE